MRWVTVATDQGPRACGVLMEVCDVNDADPELPSSLRVLLGLGPEGWRKAWAAVEQGTVTYDPCRCGCCRRYRTRGRSSASG